MHPCPTNFAFWESTSLDVHRSLTRSVRLRARPLNRIEDLRPLIPRIVDALTRIKPGEVVEIDG